MKNIAAAKKRKPEKLKFSIIAIALIACLMISGISAYFTDADTVTNTFTIGKISIDLQEPNWDAEDGEDLAPNEEVVKDPQIYNDGVNPAFVFTTVAIPYENIQTSELDGTVNAAANTQLFTLLDEDGSVGINDGWYLVGYLDDNGELSATPVYRADGTVVHVYAYAAENDDDVYEMTALEVGSTTPPVFSSVRFCNSAEDQGLETTTQDIVINAYGIQTLNISDTVGQGNNDGSMDPETVWTYVYNAQRNTFRPEPVAVNNIPGTTYVAAAPYAEVAESSSYPGIKLGSNDNYDTYYGVIKEDTVVYFDEVTSKYVSLCVGRNYTGTVTDSAGTEYLLSSDAVRYRKSEDNLPTESNPIVLYAGDVFAVTVTKGGTDTICGLSGAIKRPYIQSEDVDAKAAKYATEQLSVYIPATVGYVKYNISHCTVSGSNTDNWRIDRAYACDEDGKIRYAITISGEWEMAIKLQDRSDFIGGQIHGDEVYETFSVVIDGVELSDITNVPKTEFETLSIVETSKLYDPNDEATLSTNTQFAPIGNHAREYTFTADGLRLAQNITMDVAETLEASYMTMLPIIRGNDAQSEMQITDHYYANNDNIVYDVSVGGSDNSDGYGWKSGVTFAKIYGETSGVSATVEMIKQPEIDNAGARMFQVQSTVDKYNKLYWSICGVNGHEYACTAGENFATETVFCIDVAK